jgi:RimJ/RimL family protein N-acetyltransferase
LRTGARLRGRRVLLDPAGATDLPEVLSLWTRPEVRKYLFDDQILSRAEVADHLQASADSFAAHGYGVWLVRLEPQGRPEGFAGLLAGSAGPPSLVVGTAPERWGEGLAFEAASVMLEHAFSDLGLAEVRADADELNAASLRLLEKLGFAVIGRGAPHGRPLVYYSLAGLPAGGRARGGRESE